MIQMQTYLKVADNTGAKELMCIRVLGGSPQEICQYRRCSRGFRQEGSPRRHRQEGRSSPCRNRTPAKGLRREDGTYIRFDENAAVIIKEDKNPVVPVSLGQ